REMGHERAKFEGDAKVLSVGGEIGFRCFGLWTSRGDHRPAVEGPETKASEADFPADAEFFGITFKLGSFMPHLPLKTLLDRQDATLPEASSNSFWLHGSAWELPTFESADVFVNRLIRQGILVRDPVVEAAIQGHTPDMSPSPAAAPDDH
ncbi:MAG TPA: hypothetical protein VHJ78_03400, partial [Actinomycetota bacterium]|nr:hypothetical protein [Actinomycetota bacterium]